MIHEFADYHPSQHPGGGHSSFDEGRDCRHGLYGLAASAGILGVDMTLYEELGWDDIEDFGDVLADEDQVFATLAAGAGVKVMAMLDPG